MDYIPVPGVLQAEYVFRWDNQIVENVHHYKVEGAIDLTAMNALGLFLRSHWDSAIQPGTAANVTLTHIKITDLSTQNGMTINYATGLPLTGLAASPSAPNSVTVCLTKRTALRGRSFRGRTYYVGLTEANVVGNTIDSSTLAFLLTEFNNLITGPAMDMVVVSRFSGNAPRAEGIATPVIGFTSDGFVDSQRRRLPGRGN